MPYIGTSPSNGVRRVFDYTATAGQTSFSGTDNNSQTLVYQDSAYIDVYQNGILLIPSDYVATTGTTVVLDTGATVSASGGNFTGDITSGGLPVKVAGKESMWIPALAMNPTVSNGCAAHASVETTSGRPDMIVLDFDKDSDEFAQFSIAFPKSWDEGTITYQVYWAGIAATTGVAWSLAGVAVSNNETIDVAFGTAVVIQDDAQGAVEEVCVTAESGAVTIAGTPAADDLCFFAISRDVSDSNDDMAGDARLLGIKIFFNTDTKNDS